MDGNAIRHIRQTIQQLLDLLFPPQCVGCQRNSTVLCSACLTGIQAIASPFCQHCHAPLMGKTFCQKCAYRPLRLSGLRSAGIYQELLRTCIHALKYEGETRLAQPLGMLLARTWRALGGQSDLVVPVPLHVDRCRRRGYNHAELLARVCAQELALEYRAGLLTRIRDTQAQARLSGEERARNVAGAFRCSSAQSIRASAGKRILLIDDVSTTGATLEECAIPLFAAGARSVWGLVLARPL